MIVWGTKRVEVRLGYIAEVCPHCQTLRCIKVTRLGMASHVYFLAVNNGRLLAHLGTCEHCEGQMMLEPADYPAMEGGKNVPLEAMAARTNPRFAKSPAELQRLARQLEVRAPFLRFNQAMEDRAAKGTHFDWRAGVPILATLFGGMALGLAAAVSTGPRTETLGWLTFFWIVAGLACTFWVTHGEPRRFFRRRLWPDVQQEIATLQPDRAEIDECLARLRRYNYRIGHLVGPEELATIVPRP